MTARVRALTGEVRDRRPLGRRRRHRRRGERLDAALGAVDVAVGDEALGLEALHVGAIGGDGDGAIERLGGQRLVAGGPRRARDQQPTLDRRLGARRGSAAASSSTSA